MGMPVSVTTMENNMEVHQKTKIEVYGDFPGDPVIENCLAVQEMWVWSLVGELWPCMLWSNWAPVLQWLRPLFWSPHTTTRESVHHTQRSPMRPQRSHCHTSTWHNQTKKKKVNAIWSSSPTPEHVSRQNYNSKRHKHLMFIAALFTIAKRGKQPKCPSSDE